jgi:signal transduction histidine kinase
MAFSLAMAGVVAEAEAGRRRTERLLGDLKASYQTLQTYAGQVAELATLEERNRLARDIHDSLGHHLTAITVQLEKADTFRQHNPEEADKALQNARRSVKAALQDVRQSVSTLRQNEPPFSLINALPELVDGLSSGPLTIELDMQGQETGFSNLALMTLYRAAQEGLTNVQKHAGTDQAAVHLLLTAERATLTITDNGRGLASAVPSQNGRYGLRGIQERLELVGGQMEISSRPGQGTTLSVTVPKQFLTDGSRTPI